MLGPAKYNLRGFSNVTDISQNVVWFLGLSRNIRNETYRPTEWVLARLFQEFRRFWCSTVIPYLPGELPFVAYGKSQF